MPPEKRTERIAALARLAVGLGAIAAASACSELQTAARRVDLDKVADAARDLGEAARVGPEEERELGREVAANLFGKYGLFDDEAATLYVSLVGSAVARRAGREGVRYRFGILNTAAVNAYAAPDGTILVTKGLLKRLRSEAELAGVLAHEVAHVDRAHAVAALRKTRLLEAGAKALRSAGGKARRLETLSGFLIELAEKGFSREDELDADARGVRLAAEAGYQAKGLPAALERLYAAGEKASSLRFQRRHPPLAERVAALNAPLAAAQAKGATLKKRYLEATSF